MFARYASAVTAGTLMTFALLYAMQGLIDLQPGATSEVRTRAIVPWIPVDAGSAATTAARSPDRQGNSQEGAGATHRQGACRAAHRASTFRSGRPAPDRSTPDLIALPDPDNPLISIVRVQPTYPAVAEQRGLEGWVDVRFDVMTNGQVTNIEVMASSDRIFEKAAIKAAQRFRFKAPVVNGVPQVATGVDYRFRFEMND